MMTQKVNIKMGELIMTRDPERYCILGLGSCLGIVMYDDKKSYFGLAHAALPIRDGYSNIAEMKANLEGYFTDSAIDKMVNGFMKNGIFPERLNAFLIGGGKIFENDPINIGNKNITTAKKKLAEYGIKLAGEFVGGNRGKSVYHISKEGVIKIRSDGKHLELGI